MEAVVAYCGVLSRTLLGRTEENDEGRGLCKGSDSGPTLEYEA
jgi:hypothetical protein